MAQKDVFCKKSVLKILKNSQENNCSQISFVNKVAGLNFQFLDKYCID